MSTIVTPVCRLCLEVIAKGKTFYNIDQQDGLQEKVQNVQNIREIINFGVPEVDTYLSLNPSVCEKCLDNLIQIYNYKKCFLKVEDIIRKHSKATNPIGGNYVDLCHVVKQQYALALRNKKLPPEVIQAQINDMDKVLQNTRKLVPPHVLNVMAQRFSETERGPTPSSKNSNNSISTKYSLRHHVPSLLAASSSRPQPPIDLDNPQNSFLGSLNLISSESPSTSNQRLYPKNRNKKLLIKRRPMPKRNTNPAAPANDTVIILDDDDSDMECVETSKNSSKSDDNNEVLIMNYVEENKDKDAESTAADEATKADNSSTAVSDPATTDTPELPIITAKPTHTVINSGEKSVTAATTRTVADNGTSAAESGTPTSKDKLESSVVAVIEAADGPASTSADGPASTSADGPASTSADVPNNSVVSADEAPEVIVSDEESLKSTPMLLPVPSSLEKPKTAKKTVVVKLLPLDLEDLKRKVDDEKSHEEEIPSKRKKVLTVNLNRSLPYLHKNKKLIVKIERAQFLACELCKFVTNQGKDAMKQHGLRRHKVCMLCDYQCSTSLYLNKHLNRHHFEEIAIIIKKSKEESDTITCDFCSYIAVSGYDFRDHMVKKHCESPGAKDYECPYENCSLKYNQIYNLAQHVEKNHILARKLICVICNQKCSSIKFLKIHLQSHNPREIICSLCSMSFRGMTFLRNHMKSKHPGIDTESNIAGMAHENLMADDNGHITLDSFVNRGALPNEETGANRGTLTTDENGRIVLNLPRPNPLISDPNVVVNLDERCSFEYPSLSEMLCESSFLQQHQEVEGTVVVGQPRSKPSKRKVQNPKRKRVILNKSNRKRKVLEVNDDVNDCMIIDKEIVTVDVSDEEALLITDSDDDDCTIVSHNVERSMESESESGQILPDATADSRTERPIQKASESGQILPDATADSRTERPIQKAIRKSHKNVDGNIIISDTESKDSDPVIHDEPDTNFKEQAKTSNLESDTSHKEIQNIVESITENLSNEITNSNKMEEDSLKSPVESPSSSNDKVDEHSDNLELKNISKKCTEVAIGAENVSGDAGQKCEEPTSSSDELLKESNTRNLDTDICTASMSSSNELSNKRVSDTLESGEQFAKTPESEKMVESTNNLIEPLEEKVSENLELEKSSANTAKSSSDEPLKGEGNSENPNSENSSDKLVESTNNLHEPLTEKVSENLELEKSSAKTSVMTDKIDSNNLVSEKPAEKIVEPTTNNSDGKVSTNLELEESSETFADSTGVLNELLEENSDFQMSPESISSSDEFLKQNVSDNLESEEASAKLTESGSNDMFKDKVDPKNQESEKSTNNLNEILNEQITENMDLEELSASGNMEFGLNKLSKGVDSKNLEAETSSEKLAKSIKDSNIVEEKLFEILDLEEFSVMDADSATILNEPLKESVRSEYFESEMRAEAAKSSDERLKETGSKGAADSVSSSHEQIPNELLKENVSEMVDNFESSAATDLPSSTNELLKETISQLFDMKQFTDLCLESTSTSNDLLREKDNEISNDVESEVCAKLTTNSSNEILGDFGSSRVNQSDSTNDVIASTISSIEQLRFILEDA